MEQISKEVAKTRKALRKRIRRLERGIEEKERTLLLSKKSEELQHKGDLLKANFHLLKLGQTSITVTDWEGDVSVTIELDPKFSPKEQIAKYYKKVKKLQKATGPLTTILSHLAQELATYNASIDILSKIATLEELKEFQKKYDLFQIAKKEKVNPKKILPYHHFYTESGLSIYVGKNAASNDIMTFQMARGDDLFFHLHGAQGAHVILKKKNDIPFDQASILDAAQLALFFSKARGKPIHEHEVTIAERRYVSKGKAKGLALVSKHKTIRVLLDLNRVDEIKKRISRHS